MDDFELVTTTIGQHFLKLTNGEESGFFDVFEINHKEQLIQVHWMKGGYFDIESIRFEEMKNGFLEFEGEQINIILLTDYADEIGKKCLEMLGYSSALANVIDGYEEDFYFKKTGIYLKNPEYLWTILVWSKDPFPREVYTAIKEQKGLTWDQLEKMFDVPIYELGAAIKMLVQSEYVYLSEGVFYKNEYKLLFEPNKGLKNLVN